ncbi:hypothetical protein AKJ57_05865 [candidate division MSBL1 archaeon SCGC-AAA259A05]|uniref:SpoVT-AbrB domain-containing protein n=1 Tax=candidate division MSBL1 archaeon SCGC-AAA259A05 TaxID=1698259 RepID=A0A133U4H3_9EURY|nr:hypothetical protein AKJ57_05865 [candidate division MSBL1 archaeon SCGC-AAA259A05]
MEKDEEKLKPKFYGSTTVGSRGQIVIPSELREELDIDSGEKLLFVRFPNRKREFLVMMPEALLYIEKFAKRLREKAELDEE